MSMSAEEIIERFNMQAHPEGGFSAETYRSPIVIPGMERNLVTVIYFLLRAGETSSFHRIKSDEWWFFHQGNPLIVHTLDENGHTEHMLGNDLKAGATPQLLVEANTIFGSGSVDSDGYSLVSCVVAPGFDFADFELFERSFLLEKFPEHANVIRNLTRG